MTSTSEGACDTRASYKLLPNVLSAQSWLVSKPTGSVSLVHGSTLHHVARVVAAAFEPVTLTPRRPETGDFEVELDSPIPHVRNGMLFPAHKLFAAYSCRAFRPRDQRSKPQQPHRHQSLLARWQRCRGSGAYVQRATTTALAKMRRRQGRKTVAVRVRFSRHLPNQPRGSDETNKHFAV